MRALISADWHFTDRPQDAYRFWVIDWLVNRCRQTGIEDVIFLGDLTHEKDRHSGTFIELVTRRLEELSLVARLHILLGNHDYYAEPGTSTFRFLRFMPNVKYYAENTIGEVQGEKCAFIPHGPIESIFKGSAMSHRCPFTFFHFALMGAKMPSGFQLPNGPDASMFGPKSRVFGGDIHTPQTLGRAIYAGAPHPIAFGDEWQPRILEVNGEKTYSHKHPTIAKHTIRVTSPGDVENFTTAQHDHAKIILTIPRSEFAHWPEYQRYFAEWAKQRNVHLYGTEVKSTEQVESLRQLAEAEAVMSTTQPSDLVSKFGQEQGLETPIIDTGIELVS